MLAHFIQVQYCYEYLVNQIPMGLLLYSHLPVALMALVFSTYVLLKARNLPSLLLFSICSIFTVYCAFDLSAWFSFLGSANTMFTWSLLDFMAVLMFFFSYYFLFTFVSGNDLPLWQKIAGSALLIMPATVSYLGWNIPMYDLNSCTALEDKSFTIYTYGAEAVLILASLIFVTLHYRHSSTRIEKRRTLLTGVGVLIFLSVFFSASFLVSQLADTDASSYVYNYLIYGLFGMPVFLIYLGYLIVRYRAFDLKIFAAQALVLALIAVIGSEFAFVSSLTTRVLVSLTLVLTGAIGIVLIRSVQREITQREHIEKLAKDLGKANEQQIVLIHFITHQIKGFVTKSRNIFAGIKEGDYGVVPETMRPLIEEGFNSDTKGAQTIQEILNASNIKSGKVTYTMAPFDFKLFIEEIVKDLTPAAEAKGLELNTDLGEGTDIVNGDRGQLVNVFKNLIDNSIKYTQKGDVNVSLKKEAGKIVFTIQDTGVGITPEDMKNLFTEGGHGKESTKVNVESTGFGLYIVKNIIDAHKGRVWAESEGAGKGSRFIVELPA